MDLENNQYNQFADEYSNMISSWENSAEELV